MEKKKKLIVTLIALGVIIVILGIISLIAACASDENRLDYELDGDSYVVVDIKNTYRDGWFCRNSLTVPATHKGKPVTTIKKLSAPGLKELIVSEGITTINGSAFNGNTSLVKVTLPSTLTSLGSSAFRGCTSLTDVNIPNSLTSISSSTFQNCTSLEKIDLANVYDIGNSAFSGCRSLTTVTINDDDIEFGTTVFTNTKYRENVVKANHGLFIVCGQLLDVDETELVNLNASGSNVDGITVYLSYTDKMHNTTTELRIVADDAAVTVEKKDNTTGEWSTYKKVTRPTTAA
jgi:hypothetical protein